MSAPHARTEHALAKVPEVTLGFWLIKIAATTLGETGGDAVSMSMNLGYPVGTGIFAATFISRLLPMFPPVVTGVIISVIGLSLLRVAANWAGGGVGNPNFGAPLYLGVALVVLVSIILITRFVKGFFANISVLLGLVIGFVIALALGQVSFTGVAEAPWAAAIYPFMFGPPKFDLVAIVTMCALTTILFLGGWQSPIAVAPLTLVPGIFWFIAKVTFVFFMFAMVKAMVPRYRYDQLMRLGWKVFLPLSLVMVVVVAGVLQFGNLAP